MKKLVILFYTITTIVFCQQEQWQLIYDFEGTDFSDIYFTNSEIGWVSKESPMPDSTFIYQTIDGGYEWSAQLTTDYFPGYYNGVRSLFFLNDSTGWAASDTALFSTTNGGEDWTLLNININFLQQPLNIQQVMFLDEQTGFIKGTYYYSDWQFGSEDIIAKTTNGGADWSIIFHSIFGNELWGIPIGCEAVECFTFVDSLNGIFGLPCSGIASTNDGGASWEFISVPEISEFEDIEYIGNGQYIGIGANPNGDIVIVKSGDFGFSWYLTVINNFPDDWYWWYSLKDIYFVDFYYGWIVGHGGILLTTTDGGETWELEENFTNVSLNKVSFINRYEGWILTSNGLIFHSLRGDVVEDQEIDILDIVRIVAIIIGFDDPPSEYELWAADINDDEMVDVLDIVMMIEIILS